MPKREPPEAQTGGSIEDTILQPALDSLRLQIAKAEQWLVSAKQALAKWESIRVGEGVSQPQRSIADMPYIGKDVIDAILDFLDERGRALSREEIISTVLARGVFLGRGLDAKGQPEVQVAKSLKYHLLSREEKQQKYKRNIRAVDPALREMNGLIGRSGWGDEKFVVEGQ